MRSESTANNKASELSGFEGVPLIARPNVKVVRAAEAAVYAACFLSPKNSEVSSSLSSGSISVVLSAFCYSAIALRLARCWSQILLMMQIWSSCTFSRVLIYFISDSKALMQLQPCLTRTLRRFISHFIWSICSFVFTWRLRQLYHIPVALTVFAKSERV